MLRQNWQSLIAVAIFPSFLLSSCILSFESLSDCRAVESASQNKEVNGRKVVCSPATPEDYTALVSEAKGGSGGGGKGGQGKSVVATEGTQLKLFNLPYNTTEEELKAVFPQSRHTFFPKNKSGNACG